jgi:signal peptidase I
MPTLTHEKFERSTRRFALVLSAGFVLLFFYIAARRLSYPFEVDRVESGMMTSVWRLGKGYPLYSAPSMTWAPFLYAPLFFYLSAAMAKLTGMGYAALRMVSILSTLGTFGLIYAMVWRETRRRAAAFFAVGLFASMYAISLAWFDVGRVDSLSVFLFLAALYATRNAHPLVAAVFWLLTFHAKQTYLPLGLAVFLVEWQRPRRMFMGMAGFAAMAAASVVWLNHVTHDWYRYYVFGTTTQLAFVPREAFEFIPADLLSTLSLAIMVIGAAALLVPMQWRQRDGSFFLIVSALLLAAVWFVRAHAYANINGTIPLYAWIAILTGIAAHRLLQRWELHPGSGQNGADVSAGLLWMALCIQLLAHIYRPGQVLPAKVSRDVRQHFVDRLRATPGDVWVVNHSYDGVLAGKPTHPETDALDVVLARKDSDAASEFSNLVAAQHFTAVVLDRSPGSYSPTGIFTDPPFGPVYGLRAMVPGTENGAETDQPQFLMLPCSTASSIGTAGLLNLNSSMVDRANCPH